MTHNMHHRCSHFFHNAMGIYMGGLTLDANTLYVDIGFLKPFLHTCIAMVGKGLTAHTTMTYWSKQRTTQ